MGVLHACPGLSNALLIFQMYRCNLKLQFFVLKNFIFLLIILYSNIPYKTLTFYGFYKVLFFSSLDFYYHVSYWRTKVFNRRNLLFAKISTSTQKWVTKTIKIKTSFEGFGFEPNMFERNQIFYRCNLYL